MHSLGRPSRLSLSCAPISELEETVRNLSGGEGAQVRYLLSYLRRAASGTRTIIVESPYVDRHWLEEYTGYYATMLASPQPQAARLHFVECELTTDALMAGIRSLCDSGEFEERVRSAYQGFAVIRPLASAPIGRTVLRPYGDDPARCYAPAHMKNTVHLAGMEIRFPGLPFQQQDQGVGACATAALWAGLAKVMRNDGCRPVTPLTVTRWATEQRSYPAHDGLDLEQMAAAIHAAGYNPHLFQPLDDHGMFLLALKCYLRSGIPVVLRLMLPDATIHAITLAGFREASDHDIEVPQGSRVLRSKGIERLYAHDDRMGPYARLSLREDDGSLVLKLVPLEAGYEHLVEDMTFSEALVPLYPKLRLSAEELITFAMECVPWLELLSKRLPEMRLEPWFELSGRYLESLRRVGLSGERFARIVCSVGLSRYVGVLRWTIAHDWFLDIVVDTTDLRRDDTALAPLIAVIPADERLLPELESNRDDWFGPRPLLA